LHAKRTAGEAFDELPLSPAGLSHRPECSSTCKLPQLLRRGFSLQGFPGALKFRLGFVEIFGLDAEDG
jgi:hypothetical protein